MTPNPIRPAFRPAAVPATIEGGVLGDRLPKNIDNLLRRIELDQFVAAFRDEHDAWYAEPEFAGHYLDAALAVWRTRGDAELLDRARTVAAIIQRYQRADGYLGTYKPGLEFDPSFSVWNQQFSIMGLLLYHAETGDDEALHTAQRCADYLVENFLRPDGPSLFDAIGQGTSKATILIEFVRLYEHTTDPRYLAFAEWIVERWEQGSMRYISGMEVPYHGAALFMVGSLKGLETILCYRGILRLGIVTGNDRYIRAAAAYWESLRLAAIGPTGNGTIFEMWSPIATHPLELTTQMHPFENCVAVGWMQLSVELFAHTGDGTYLDEYERTLYNHLLGAQATDGHDFSYYQGNVGTKVHETDPNAYSCCRYRGMTMLAHLPEHVVFQRDDAIAVALYVTGSARAEVRGVPVDLHQSTDYPRSGEVRIEVEPAAPAEFALLLRVPGHAPLSALSVNGKPVPTEVWTGLAEIRRNWAPGDVVVATFDPQVRQQHAVIADRPAVMTTYGALVLALDTRERTPLDATSLTGGDLVPAHPADWTRIARFVSRGIVDGQDLDVPLVDFASAGSLAPGVDRFRVWITDATNRPQDGR